MYTLRHGFFTHLPRAGTDIRTAQKLLDHGDMSTAMIYTHVLRNRGGNDDHPAGHAGPQLDPRHESGLAFPHADAKLQSNDPLHAQVLRKIKPTLTPGA